MDETGFSIGTMQSTRIIVDSSLRTRFQAHPGRQEWVSAVECICMDGTAIDPLIIFKGQNILQSWIPKERGSGLQPFQPQTVIRAATLPTIDVIVERPHTPTEHDIFEKVFLNSSPPDFQTLHKANTVLSSTISRGILTTPTKRYINKLADETERLNTRHILQQRETANLRNIIQKRRAQNKGKRAVLKGQFHISTEELRSQVVEAEAATAAATATASQRSRTTPRPINEAVIKEIDEESEEELYDSDLDELAL
ncbi:hypothetical protein V497_00248 [Pseudogymnoascus sp. VKM F-4516 (FW-969)]|nr:hypothetical protein V497_00248 [Pseudogymnoascus sp. VKM F-4516 (FW-969)]